MRSMYSASIAGTHHIFFAPRLELVARQDDADALAPDFVDDTSASRLLGHQAHGPAGASHRRRPAHQRDDGRFLVAVELAVGLGTRILAEREREPTGQVALADATYLARILPNRQSRRAHRAFLVEQLQDTNASPQPSGHCPTRALHLVQLPPVRVAELQSLEALLVHYSGRSNYRALCNFVISALRPKH